VRVAARGGSSTPLIPLPEHLPQGAMNFLCKYPGGIHLDRQGIKSRFFRIFLVENRIQFLTLHPGAGCTTGCAFAGKAAISATRFNLTADFGRLRAELP
jgi:hypothetical protein